MEDEVGKNDFTFQPPNEAPVYRPEPEDFDDPFEFINKIRPVAEKFGICRIVPPSNWRPPFSVNVDKFTFNPRVQHLKELEATTRIKLMFLQELSEFWSLQGNPLKMPVVEEKILDLHQLKTTVDELGGNKVVMNSKLWTEVANKLGLSSSSSNALVVKNAYELLIKPFVAFNAGQRFKWKLYVKKIQQNNYESDCRLFCRRLICFWRLRGRKLQWPLLEKKSIDLYGLHLAVLKQGNVENADWNRLTDEMNFSTIQTNVDRIREVYLFMVKPFVENGGIDNKEVITSEENGSDDTQPCDVCGKGETNKFSLNCFRCGKHFHTYCLTLATPMVTKRGWHCYECTSFRLALLREPYGFAQSTRDYTLEQFGRMAVKFKEDHFGMPALNVPTRVVEQEYWRLLSSFDESVTVEYGADVQSSNHGMGFPKSKGATAMESNDDYTKSKWNLNNIPVSESSVYSYIGAQIPGVTVPWIYVGMCFSTFCWHIEDHWSYSINYLHWGEPKTWYSIPGSEADNFEKVLQTQVPQLFSGQPDLLHDLSTTINPNLLTAQGISVYRTDQSAGEFVVTFPRAYHAGFNQGFNFAEAVNFAPADWIQMGRQCIDHYATVFHSCVFSHDELICKMAQKAELLNDRLARATLLDLVTMLKNESTLRKTIENEGVTLNEQRFFENIPDDSRQCCHCRTTCFLSAVYCSCNERLFCLNDFKRANQSCSCPNTNLVFVYRYKLDTLLSIIENLHRILKSHESGAARSKPT